MSAPLIDNAQKAAGMLCDHLYAFPALLATVTGGALEKSHTVFGVL